MNNPEFETVLLHQKADEYFELWRMSDLIGQVRISYSNHLTSTLGRSRVDTQQVRLNPELAHTDQYFLDEVLCHELAHIAVYQKYGPGKRPHGREWATFVRQAGFEPKVRLGGVGRTSQMKPDLHRRFEHLCPICQTTRYARRPISRWRCAVCNEAGLDGKLVIREATP